MGVDLTSANLDTCVRSEIDSEAPGLLSAPFIPGGVIDVRAESIACGGTVDEIEVDANADGPEGIGVVIGSGGSRDCFGQRRARCRTRNV